MKPRFGKYRLIAKLATGGMARVFLAEQSGLEGFTKKVVIKRMRIAQSRDSSLNAQFFTEAVLAGQLNHPNLVHIYDFSETDGERFIVMEYVDGPSLKKLLQIARKRDALLPMELCLKVASLVCEGLAYAHAKHDERTGEAMKLVHRDVTPDNILFARSGAVKIADFGIAKAATQLHETRAGDVKGKLQYIAPEQLLSEPIDARADLFSLGVVLHEMLTGVGPFARENDAAVMDAIVHDEVPPLNELRPEAPPALDAIIRRATAKRAEGRFGSALEMQEAIDRALLRLDMAGPAQLRQLVEALDPAPLPTGEEETTTDAEALGDEEPGTQIEEPPPRVGRAVTREEVPSVDIPITGQVPVAMPPPRRRSVVLPVLIAIAVTVPVTAYVVRELTPAVIVEAPAPEPGAKVEPGTKVEPGAKVEAGAKVEPTAKTEPAPKDPGLGLKADAGENTEPIAKAEPGVNPDAGEKTEQVAKTEPGVKASDPDPEAQKPDPPEKFDPLPGRARVQLQSTPEANVYLDGKSVGRTPLALPVKFGTHKIRFEDPQAFLNKTLTLTVPEEREYSKAFVFERARLFVMAPDGSTIYVNKKKAGKVPGPILLYEGTYTVRVVYAATELDLSKKLELKPGDRFEPFVE